MIQFFKIYAFVLLHLCCFNRTAAQKILSFPLDTEGVTLRAFVLINRDLPPHVSLKQIQEAAFLPISDAFLGQQAAWLQFSIDNKLLQDTTLNILFDRPMEAVQVFRQEPTQLRLLTQIGRRLSAMQPTFIYKLNYLELPLRGQRLDTFYLRIQGAVKQPFPRIFSGSFLPQKVLIQQFTRFESERWFYFFMAGFSVLMSVWAFFKSATNHWDKPNLYCSLMFLSHCLNAWFWTNTVKLPLLPIFAELTAASPIGLWFNHLTPLLMWLLYHSFLNLRVEKPKLSRFMTICIGLLIVLNGAHIAFSLQLATMPIALIIEKAIEIVMLFMQLILPFFFLTYWRHPIYRYVALSSWLLLIAFATFLLILRFDGLAYLPIGFNPIFILFIALAIDGILFMVALTLRDRQIALEKIRLEQQATANELKSLRAQMNPHFIFNALNSIKSYALNKDTEGVNFYLTKFSKLIRQVLENSRSERITLKNELETLELYLDIEKLRVGDKFDYTITIAEDVETDFIEVPPMLIQPYIENAIWHGLMHLESSGHVTISISQKDDKLLIINILDNGIGRGKAAELKSKTGASHKSFGMKITAERLDIIRQLYAIDARVEINDLKNKEGIALGTSVTLQIPI